METLTIDTILNLLKSGSIELKSTHQKLCYPIIVRIYRKMLIGIEFNGIKVDGDIIIDGHHRYLASLLADVSLEKYPSNRTSATSIFQWIDVEIVSEDWDTKAKVLMLNEFDAKYNNISLEKLIELLK